MAEKIYIFGCGGHAKVVAATARLCGYEVAGFWEDSSARIGTSFFGSRIITFESVPRGASVFVAFGDNYMRLQKGRALQDDFRILTIIHPSAQISEGVRMGVGCYCGAVANIDPDCSIGDFSIVNNCANISHDTMIGDACHICGGAQIAGGCCVGSCTMLGIGSCVIEKRTIGDHTVIGAGGSVICDIPANVIAVGTPAKVIRSMNDPFAKN